MFTTKKEVHKENKLRHFADSDSRRYRLGTRTHDTMGPFSHYDQQKMR